MIQPEWRRAVGLADLMRAALLVLLRFPATGSTLREGIASLRSVAPMLIRAQKEDRLRLAICGRGFLLWTEPAPGQRTLEFVVTRRDREGVGGRIVKRFLDDCDQASADVALVCRMELTAWYEGHGFLQEQRSQDLVFMRRRHSPVMPTSTNRESHDSN